MRHLIIIPPNVLDIKKDITHDSFDSPNLSHLIFTRKFVDKNSLYKDEFIFTDDLPLRLLQDGYIQIHTDEERKHAIFYLPFIITDFQAKYIQDNFNNIVKEDYDIYIKSIETKNGDYIEIEENNDIRNILKEKIEEKTIYPKKAR